MASWTGRSSVKFRRTRGDLPGTQHRRKYSFSTVVVEPNVKQCIKLLQELKTRLSEYEYSEGLEEVC
jgi:hypothetical protein